MGPACVQMFLVVAKKLSLAGDSVGARNAKKWTVHQQKLDGCQDMSDLIMMVKGFRISSAYKEGLAKLVFSLADPDMQRTFQECVIQLGGELRQGIAPR